MGLRIILILCALSIAYLSLMPAYTVTISNDKLGHLIAYAVLTTIIGLVWYPNLKSFGIGVLLALLYGVLIEFAQHFIPGRSLSVYDMLANASGVLIGIIITVIFHRPILKILKYTKII